MTVIPVTRNVVESDPNTPAQPLGANDTLNLSANAGIFALGTGNVSRGIAADGGNIMNLAGGVYSREGDAILSAAGNNTISIATTGSLYGFVTGVSLLAGGNAITNSGRISGGTSAGILINGTRANVVTNNGAISAGGGGVTYGINMAGTGNTLNNNSGGTIEAVDLGVAVQMNGSVTNSGTIYGGNAVNFSAGGANTLNNSGTLIGAFFAVVGNANADTITNTGMIRSAIPVAISLAAGDDRYDGRLGQVIGEVLGDGGNDTLLGGAFFDILRGGAENDVLDGGGGVDFLDGGSGNDVYLLGADMTDILGDASGTDAIHSTVTRNLASWAFIENLVLEGNAHVNGTGNNAFNGIIGNSGNNILAGQAGNDALIGGGGADQLFGQADKDSLTGGAGNDTLGFQTVAHTAAGNGDVIVDLDDNGDDVIDLTGISPDVLTFIGQQAFTAAGQVRFQQVGGHVLVEINTTGPSGAEGEITLLNTTLGNGGAGQVNAADFLL